MVKVIQCLAFTRHIENTLNIDEETCERWTTYAKDWGVTNLDGTPLIVTPELVEDNWGGVGVKVNGHYGIRSLYEILRKMAEEDCDMELWSDHYDSSDWNEDDVDEGWTVRVD